MDVELIDLVFIHLYLIKYIYSYYSNIVFT